MDTRCEPKLNKAKFWSRIQGQLIFVLLLMLIPILLIHVQVLNKWYKTRYDSELQANIQIARAVAKTFEEFVHDVLHQEYAIGEALIIPSLSTVDRQRLIDVNMSEYESFLNLLWISTDGIVLNSHLPEVTGLSVIDWDHIRKIIDGQQWAVSDLIVAKAATREPIINIARGIRNDAGQLLGIVAVSISSDR